MAESIQQLISKQADFICRYQLSSGAIPWYKGGITDPWDHIECAIALDLAGQFREATRAYLWLHDTQNPDGSWYSSYLDKQPQDLTRDTNFSSYIATGAWCHYLATNDLDFLHQMWITIEKSIAFALRLQQPSGEVFWALDINDNAWPGAILAASCCVWQNIRCGMRIVRTLGGDKPEWDIASRRLATAIIEHPELFDKFGENKHSPAVNWFYPVVSGIIEGDRAKQHILKQWADFVIDGWGCRCVADTAWVTAAETSELIWASSIVGEHDKAKLMLNWLLRFQDSDDGFWAGIKLPEQIVWPEEKTTWTSAGVIIAATSVLQHDRR